MKHKEGDFDWTAEHTPKSVPEHLREPPPGSLIKMRFFGKRIRKLYQLPGGVEPVEDCRKLIPHLEAYYNSGSTELTQGRAVSGGTKVRHVASLPAGTQVVQEEKTLRSPSKRQKLDKMCEDCGLVSKNYGTIEENLRRWCANCAKKHGAVLLKGASAASHHLQFTAPQGLSMFFYALVYPAHLLFRKHT